MDEKTKKNALHRLKIMEGHIKAIKRMVEDNAYCVDVVHQSMAVQRALKKFDIKMIENHLNTCVVDQIKSGQTKKSVEELLSIYDIK